MMLVADVLYSVSQKSSPPPKKKLFAIFSLKLSIFSMKFCKFVVSLAYIHTCVPILVDLLWYLTKWRLFS